MQPIDDDFFPLFERLLEQAPDRTFAQFPGKRITFADIDTNSRHLCAWLMQHGVAGGDRVALMLHNSPLSLYLLFALARLGAVWVPVNTKGRGDNLVYILKHCEPNLVVVEDALQDVVAVAGDLSKVITVVSASKAEGSLEIIPGTAPPAAAYNCSPDDVFAIMYTSGTTGPPKGVIVSHRMLRLSGDAIGIVSAAQPGDVFIMWEPLFHIGGAQMIILPLIHEVSLSFVDGFSASRFWSQVNEAGASHIHFLGGILQILLKQPPSALDRTHGARIAFGGGCPPDIWTAFEERFGLEIRECYGMTECSSVTTANLNGTVGSVGTPLPWFDVAILDADGAAVKTGERGEIVVTSKRDGALTRGYLNNPEATARAIHGQSFKTGDVGSWDENGNMYFHGRQSDSVRVNGENVSAFEVEHVAGKHPDVEDCAMIGVASDIGEGDIKLFVTPKSGAHLDPSELVTWLTPRLASYQLPRYVSVVDAFERTPSQRIMKHRLSTRTDDCWFRTTDRTVRPCSGGG